MRPWTWVAALTWLFASSATAAAPPDEVVRGYWRGYYEDGGRRVPLSAILTYWTNGRVEGRFSEENVRTPAPERPRLFSTMVEGRLDGWNLTFTKQHDGFAGARDAVRFAAVLDTSRTWTMSGRWTAGRRSGAFFLEHGEPRLAVGSTQLSDLLYNHFNRLLPLFSDIYWSFGPRLPPSAQAGGAMSARLRTRDPAIASEFITQALALNAPALAAHVRASCENLSFAQRDYLRDFANKRFLEMGRRLGPDSLARVEAALGKPVVDDMRGLARPRLTFSEVCGEGAVTSTQAIFLGDDVVLAAVLGAMMVDSLSYAVLPRALEEASRRKDSQARAWVDPFMRSEWLLRFRATPYWDFLMRRARFLDDAQRIRLPQYEASWFGERCPQADIQCWLNAVREETRYTIGNSEIMLEEQIDFVLAHELGHYALGHHAEPFTSCARERSMEREADFFAVAVTRPRTGLFTQRQSGGDARFDTRFTSGVDVFLTQSYRIAGLSGAASCAYDSMADRIAAARAFEARAFPNPPPR